jgi:hypothetical protein
MNRFLHKKSESLLKEVSRENPTQNKNSNQLILDKYFVSYFNHYIYSMFPVAKFQELAKKFFPKESMSEPFDILSQKEMSENELHQIVTQVTGELQYYAGINQSIEKILPPSESIEIRFYGEIQKRIITPELIVDLGAGVRLFRLIPTKIRIVVEHFQPYIEHLKYAEINEKTIIVKENAIDFLKNQPDSSIDLIVAVDLIEHLSKEEGKILVSEMERTTKGQSLIVTPLGFAPQHVGPSEDDEWGFTGNISQNHISGWLPEEFIGWETLIERKFPFSSGHQGNIAAIYTSRNNPVLDLEILVLENNPEVIVQFFSEIERLKNESKKRIIEKY